jgi:copper transport protein
MQRCLAQLLLWSVWLIGFLAAPSVMAHAVLLSTSPADQAMLETAPSEIVLRFNEPVSPIAIHLLSDAGRLPVSDNNIDAIDQEIRIALPQQLASGAWLLSYRVMSADSHPVAGTIQFRIGPASGSTALPAQAETAAGWHAAAALARLSVFAAIALVVGGVLSDRLVGPIAIHSRRHLVRIAAAGAALALASIGLRGGLLADGAVAGLAGLKLWRTGFHSSFGNSMICAALGFIVIGMSLRNDRPGHGTPATGFGILLILASFALSGHVATATPRWLSIPALVLHAGTMAFWIGALPPLLSAMRQPPVTAYATVRRFSRLALVGVAILIGSGLIMAIIQLGHWHALFGTSYGRLLLLKLAVVAGLIGLAAWNKLRITPEILRDPARGLSRLSGSIQVELVLALVILAVTAVLGLSSPPRTLHPASADTSAASAAGFSVAIPNSQLTATLTVTPARAGQNRLEVWLTQPDGAVLAPLEVSVDIANPDLGIEPITRQLTASGAGRYVLDSSEFALGGNWIVRVDVLVTDFDKVTLEARVPIQR